MRYWCVTDDPDVLQGLRLAGIEGVVARDADAAAEAVEKAGEDPGVAVLLVTDGIYALCRETIDELRLAGRRPLVSVISDSRSGGHGEDYITRMINEAIGVRL